MKQVAEQIIKIFESRGFSSNEEELEAALNEMIRFYGEEAKENPTKKQFLKKKIKQFFMEYLSGGADGKEITIKNLDILKNKMNYPEEWNAFPDWFFEFSMLYYSHDIRGLRPGFLYNEKYKEKMKRCVQKDGKYFTRFLDKNEIDVYELKRRFAPEEAFEMVEFFLEMELRKIMEKLEKNKTFMELNEEICSVLEQGCGLKDG